MPQQTLHTERLTLVPLAAERPDDSGMTAPVEGVEEGEVEYELTREQFERRGV